MESDRSKVAQYFRVLISLLILQTVSGCQDPCVAIDTTDSNIPDSSFTASSELGGSYRANKARFNSDSAWEATDNVNPGDYLQIDLGGVFLICAVATKGNAQTSYNEYTKQYKISTSIDNTAWTWYPSNNSPKLFPGNTDRNTAVKNVLDEPVKGRYIRFAPTAWSGYMALRVDVYTSFSCKSLNVGIGSSATVAKLPDSSMTSSSNYNPSTPPSNGRLGYTAGSSWCSATSDSSPYLQINLGSPYVICGIATQGSHTSNHWVQNYQLKTSPDGTTFTDYKEMNISKYFRGNVDSNTIVHNLLYDGAIGQYVRIQPKRHYGSTSCMRTELYGVQQTTVCTKMSMGILYSALVPNHRFIASTHFSLYYPYYARLRIDGKAWKPATPNNNDWLQIDLGSVVVVCAIATQGNPATHLNEYTKKYKLKVSLDNKVWRFYQENNADKTFTGNTDRSTIVTNTLSPPTKAKFVRFYPTDYSQSAALRVDVYGSPMACSSPFGLEKGGSIDGSKFTSSSLLDNSHKPSHGRLYGDASWCSSTSSNTEYIQIDLGKMVTLTGIATQGDPTMNKWISTYTLKYSRDGSIWYEYWGDQNTVKTFQGNSDKDGIVVKWLSFPVPVRFVRIHPQSWNNQICMRIELFGCYCPLLDDITELVNQNLTPTSGGYVDFTCKIRHQPVKYIQWVLGGNDVASLSRGVTNGPDFVLSMLRVNYTSADSVLATYKCSDVTCRKSVGCKAKYSVNGYVEFLKGVEVEVALEYPSAPSITSVDNILSKSVNVHWMTNIKASQPSIISYEIKYWNHQNTQTVNVSGTSNSLTGLSVCTYYNITIKAYSKLGGGPWSNPKTFRTDSELPRVAPSDVNAEAKSSQSIFVAWKVPTGVKCPPIGYKVVYSLTPGGLGVQQQVSVNGPTCLLTNLKKWTVYYIGVQVQNEKGFGPTSTQVEQRTMEDVPDAPPGDFKVTVISSTSIHLSWSPPPADKRNGIIRGFKVWYCKTSDCSYVEKDLHCNCTLQYTLCQLDMYELYSVRVLAHTSKGDGIYTNIVKIRTQEGRPSAPRNLRMIEFGPTGSSGPQLEVTWDEPDSINAIYIRYYTVSYQISGDSKIITELQSDNRTTAIFPVCGGVEYTVKVWAYTVSDGPKVVKTVKTNVYVPTEPIGLEWKEYNASTLDVSWLVGNPTSGPILVYELSNSLFNRSGLFHHELINVSCPALSCGSVAIFRCHHLLHNLSQCANYSLAVRAYTSKGPGSFSSSYQFKTSVPSPPRSLTASIDGKNMVKLTWLKPQQLGDPVQKYTIKYTGTKSYDYDWQDAYKTGEKIAYSESVTISDLLPATTYSFSVSATTKCDGKESNKVIATTDAEAPPDPEGRSVSIINDSVAVITLWKLSAKNGKISDILVYVQEIQENNRKRRAGEEQQLNCAEISKDAFKLHPSQTFFVLGDGKVYGEKTNHKLSGGKDYNVYQCGTTMNNKMEYLYGKVEMIAKVQVPVTKGTHCQAYGSTKIDLITVILVPSVAFLIICITIAGVIIIWKRKRKANTSNENINLDNLDGVKDRNDNSNNREDEPTYLNTGFIHNGTTNLYDVQNVAIYANEETIRHQPIPAGRSNQYVNERGNSSKEKFKTSTGTIRPIGSGGNPRNRNKKAGDAVYAMPEIRSNRFNHGEVSSSGVDTASHDPTYQSLDVGSKLSHEYQSLNSIQRERKDAGQTNTAYGNSNYESIDLSTSLGNQHQTLTRVKQRTINI